MYALISPRLASRAAGSKPVWIIRAVPGGQQNYRVSGALPEPTVPDGCLQGGHPDSILLSKINLDSTLWIIGLMPTEPTVLVSCRSRKGRDYRASMETHPGSAPSTSHTSSVGSAPQMPAIPRHSGTGACRGPPGHVWCIHRLHTPDKCAAAGDRSHTAADGVPRMANSPARTSHSHRPRRSRYSGAASTRAARQNRSGSAAGKLEWRCIRSNRCIPGTDPGRSAQVGAAGGPANSSQRVPR